MDSSKIKAIIVAILAGFAALYLGISAATAQFETVGWVVGAAAFTICLLLGRRIYLLIPFLSSLGLVFPLPGNFSTDIISYGVVLCFLTLLFLSRRLPMKGGVSELEIWCGLLFLTVAQAYLRNPVGLNLFGAESVGAKPYAVFGLTTVCAFALSLLSIEPHNLKLWVRLSFLGSITNFAIGCVGFLFPQLGYYLGASFTSDLNRGSGEGQASRVAFVRRLSVALATWISSRKPPLAASFHPAWAPLVLFSLFLAAISGYRNQLVLVCLIFLIGICYRGGMRSVVASFLIGASMLVLLAFTNIVVPLPANIQRALSFLPGTWDQELRDDASNSTEWRVEMWKNALLTDYWIQNKMLGDGLGLTRKELERTKDLDAAEKGNTRGRSGLTVQQESMMISGGYHSGPVQTVRTTGYVGLAVLWFAMIRVAVHAHRQIKRCRGTEWFPTALFLGIPLVAAPFFWAFVFGTFDGGASGVMMGTAIVRLMEKNLPLPAYVVRRREAYVLDRRRMEAARAAKS
ncbi:MAG: hypothetical protein KDL87_14045 [Verrucomicrobiae bacterium]|nr:hypothetical protein [Verrucomicrobiae bacterium]